MLQSLLRASRRRSRNPVVSRPFRFAPGFQSLERREVPAVLATFAFGQLSISGDNLDNAVTVSRDAAGKILANGGAVATAGRAE